MKSGVEAESNNLRLNTVDLKTLFIKKFDNFLEIFNVNLTENEKICSRTKLFF